MIPTRFDRLGLAPYYGKRLNYIESTGTQYIDTGVAPDFAGGDSVEIRFNVTAYGADSGVVGCRASGVRNGVYLLGVSLVVCDADGYTVVSCDPRGERTISVSDLTVTNNGTPTAMPRRVTCALPVYLFSFNNVGSAFGIYSGMRLYDWKYYRAGVLAQHLVPVLDKSGVPCLFDTVSRRFKRNAGSGTFNYA